jgi:predicted RNA-binding protein with RPS1 domain
MFNVRIEYKSGKIEVAEIAIKDYVKALENLTKEGRLVSMKIISTQ